MRHHGMEAAARYQALIAAAVRLLQDTPSPPYSQPVRREPGVRALHLRHATRLLSSEDRVRNARHLLLYRVAADGVLEVLGSHMTACSSPARPGGSGERRTNANEVPGPG